VKVRTTIAPDQVLEVDPVEARQLRRQGLLIEDPYTGEIPAAKLAADQKKEGQE
jgi:hypothetical protein